MRRNLISLGTARIFLSGVMASVIKRNRKVQSPVACVIFSIGLAPRWPVYAPQANLAKGPKHRMKTTTLVKRIMLRWLRGSSRLLAPRFLCGVERALQLSATIWRSEVLLQIHSRVQAGNLVVSVELESGPF